MTRPATTLSLTSEFNEFLFAPVGTNSNGVQVSMLSGLTQSELDPWAEAAALAQLPGKNAIARLALLIGKMPDKDREHPDTVAVATRLIALLPKQFDGSREPPVQTFSDVTHSKPWWFYVALMSFVLGSQFLIARHQSPPHVNTAAVNTSSNAPTAPAVNFNQ